MYDEVTTCVQACISTSSDFPIAISLHQDSTLSMYLFSLVIYELTKCIQEEVPWCMLFANNIVLIDETKTGVTAKFKSWRSKLEAKDSN